MSFMDWLYSSYPNPAVAGQYGWLHIAVMVFCLLFIVVVSLILKNADNGPKRGVVIALAIVLLVFEIARRTINILKADDLTTQTLLHILLPRPACAISCWLVIIAAFVNKKTFYNFASLIAILCGLAFFIYPGAGFNNEYILFENLYSIATHAVFFIAGVMFITLGHTEFSYSRFWKLLICFAFLAGYVYLEMCVLKIESDPFYFMLGNDIQEFIGLKYNIFLPAYIGFIVLWVNLFHIASSVKRKNEY